MKAALPLLLLACLGSFAAPSQAQEIGRLFFTPEQRAVLDGRRRARVPDKPAAAPVLASPTTRLDGFVRRSDGRSTVWVNGDTVDDSSPQSDGRVPVTVGDSAARVRLKPGQVLDRSSGEVSDVLGPSGEIRVRPAK
jgi:hypothetical protein